MSSIKVFPLIIVIFMIVTIFTALNIVGQESLGNSNLDNSSKTLISNLGNQLNNDFGDLPALADNLTVNESGNAGQDPFALQFLETKQQTSLLKRIVNSVVSLPDLLILGINDSVSDEELLIYKTLIVAFLIVIIFVAAFVGFFGDGRIT